MDVHRFVADSLQQKSLAVLRIITDYEWHFYVDRNLYLRFGLRLKRVFSFFHQIMYLNGSFLQYFNIFFSSTVSKGSHVFASRLMCLM